MKKFTFLSLTKAYDLALKNAPVQQSTQVITLGQTLHAVLAEDIIVKKNLPSFDNSAMDGFAFKHCERGKTLNIAGTIFAGDVPSPILKKGECYKIMTGAQVPGDADTVVPIEDCTKVTENSVTIPENIKEGNAFRPKGEEQKAGNILFKKGERVTAGHIALLSAQGIIATTVYKPLQIAVVSSGDEIKEPWEEASEDEIYNANAFAVTSLLKGYGFSASYVGSVPDSLEKSISFISKLKSYDVIITTGGISMGDADFLSEAFSKNGNRELFHGIDVKPGRPTMMGLMDNTFVMAMPGNPLTAMVNTILLSVPILAKMQGNNRYHHSYVYAKNCKTFQTRPGRANVVLGHLHEGVFTVTRNNKYGSGMLTPIVESNALAVFDQSVSVVEENQMIKIILFDSFPAAATYDSMNTNT
ncbi:molybdopterin molybdotransferase MoeA [Sulfurovum sp. ST-21]|uniref:Molybdopterin molybdenumtransferase n=1 Tax=Sulfurovum indicum TaxID=2779528 RepID=A0A7M1S1J9_9BACT|nr:molybdopterin molybdotransferase MoeA [Sulfurovum indicum]QOR61258.1 molybdopterin molybdotransferase MoeA [Sulfurovum indicum]